VTRFSSIFFVLLCIFSLDAEAKPKIKHKNYNKKFVKNLVVKTDNEAQGKQNTSFIEYYFLMDADTKEILLSKNSDERLPPSSMTKLMTAYVVFDQVKKGNISLDKICLVGKDAWRVSGSSMFLNYGDLVSIDDLVKGLLAVSANDAAVALASSIAGSVKNFADLMNITATRLKMKNSHFKNPHGLYEDGHYASIHDLATLASQFYKDFPEYSHYLEIPEFTYHNITQKNRNPLIRNNYEGIVGGKTGHTNQGGYGVVVIVKRNNRRLIAVVNKANSPAQRAKIITTIVNYGFSQFKKVNLFSKGDEVLKIPTWLGDKSEISALASKDVEFNIPGSKSIGDISAKAFYKSPLIAPISAGQKIGILQIEVSGAKRIEIDLLAKEKSEQVGLLRKMKSYFLYGVKEFVQNHPFR
jgi:D-alanyl-D-alanine carboxypeptidase (penicillin-binding protein 5/6)